MEAKRYFVRPFEEGDYGALSLLQTKLNPELPSTAEEEREWDRMLDFAHFVREKWVVEERSRGEVIAVASLNHSPHSYDPYKFWTAVIVDPDHRHSGVGRTLSSLLEAEAVAHRAVCFWTTVRKDDPISLEFSRRRGFVELRTTWMSLLDVSRSDLPPLEDRSPALERDGIRFTTLAEEGPTEPAVRARLHRLWTEAGRDVPRMGDYSPLSKPEFVVQMEGSSVLPEAFFLARYGDDYVGSSHLQRDLAQEDSLLVGFTATRPDHRGRGIATELKRRATEYARREGFRYIRTFSDSENKPIWAINERMGFRRVIEWSQQERRFGPDREAATPPSPAPASAPTPAVPGKSIPR